MFNKVVSIQSRLVISVAKIKKKAESAKTFGLFLYDSSFLELRHLDGYYGTLVTFVA